MTLRIQNTECQLIKLIQKAWCCYEKNRDFFLKVEVKSNVFTLNQLKAEQPIAFLFDNRINSRLTPMRSQSQLANQPQW